MKLVAAMLIAAPILAGCEPSPWLSDLFKPSPNQYRAAEGQEVIVVLAQGSARVGGCVIDSSKAGITVMGRYLGTSADNQKMFLAADDIQTVTIIYEGRCKAEK